MSAGKLSSFRVWQPDSAKVIIIIIIIMSLFKEDDIFSTKTNLTYGPLKSKTYINMVIYICTKYDVWNTYIYGKICTIFALKRGIELK